MTPAEAASRIAQAYVETAATGDGTVGTVSDVMDSPSKPFPEEVEELAGRISALQATPEQVAAACGLVVAVVKRADPIPWDDDTAGHILATAFETALAALHERVLRSDQHKAAALTG